MPTYILWLVVGVEGFVALAAQMLTIRQLMPFVGNNVIVTSLIIGIFLLALAVGYWQGGRIEQQAVKRLIRNFILAGVWLGIGLSYFFLAFWFLYGAQIVTLNLYILLIAYLIVVTVPPVYWLGQTVPIVMNLWESTLRAGTIGGRVLQFSTLGSFLGAVVTSIVLMNILGLGWTVFVAASLLLTLAFILTLSENHWQMHSIILVAILGFLFWLNVLGTAHFFVTTNNYGQYQVFDEITVDHQAGKMLVINNSPSSFITAEKTGFSYIELIKQIVFEDLQIKDQSILVLGAGGFTFSAQNDYGNHVTYVDIDPAILAIVKQHYFDVLNGEFIAADARVFVQQTEERYAAVITDAYSNQTTIPAHLLTVQFFNAVNQRLLPNGIAIFNMVANPLLNDPYSHAIDAGLRAIFANCVSFPEHYFNAATNIIYVCQRNDKVAMEQLLANTQADYYTDDHNRATWDQQYLLRREKG